MTEMYDKSMNPARRAVVMGATSGMGRAVAVALLEMGYLVGAAGRRSVELQNLKALHPQRVFTKVIDVTEDHAPELLLELVDEMGGMDLYFHSSGFGKQNPQLARDLEKRTVMTNCLGFTQMVDAAFAYFRDHHRNGHIAVISSVAGTKGLGVSASYSASKRFDWIYLEALAQLARMQHLDIHFTDIRPGFVSTDFIKDSRYPMEMTTQYVVKRIMTAVRRKKRHATIDWRFAIMCFFWRLLPGWLWERLPIRNPKS